MTTFSAREMISGTAAEVDGFTRMVKNSIEHCIREYMNEEETMECLWRGRNVPPRITSAIWRTLQRQNPGFFNGYLLRVELQRQIKRFNALLEQQAQIMIMNPLPQYLDNFCCQPPPLTQIDQNSPCLDDGQVMIYHNTVPHEATLVPQGSSIPLYQINDSDHMGNNMNAYNYMVPAPDSNSNLPYKFPSDSYMLQNNPHGFPYTFSEKGNMPQLPIINDSAMLPSLINHTDDQHTSLLNALISSKTDLHSPMNTEDDNGTVMQAPL